MQVKKKKYKIQNYKPMASVMIKFRPSTIAGKEGYLYYQVIQNRIVRQISTDYKVFASEWDSSSERTRYPYDPERADILQSLQAHLQLDKKLLNKIIASLDEKGIPYIADDIVTLFRNKVEEQSLFNFMQSVIAQLKHLDKIRTSETYRATLGSFIRFRRGNDVSLDEIDSDLMMEYEAWLKSKGISMNTVSFYMRILRATYNRAVEKKLTTQQYPFKHVYTGNEKTVKRAISLMAIKKIKGLDLSANLSLDWARDMFLFSFYTRGMSFIDLAYLKKNNLKNGILSYYRKKTNQQLHVRWEKCMQDIIDKYSQPTTKFLMPIITDPALDERKQYENALHLMNHKLKEIGSMISLQIPLTSYVSRHAWASIAKGKNIPLSIISEGMGHDSENTTQIYLASLDNSVIDNANMLILKEL